MGAITRGKCRTIEVANEIGGEVRIENGDLNIVIKLNEGRWSSLE
jgi:hypothetical protein